MLPSQKRSVSDSIPDQGSSEVAASPSIDRPLSALQEDDEKPAEPVFAPAECATALVTEKKSALEQRIRQSIESLEDHKQLQQHYESVLQAISSSTTRVSLAGTEMQPPVIVYSPSTPMSSEATPKISFSGPTSHHVVPETMYVCLHSASNSISLQQCKDSL